MPEAQPLALLRKNIDRKPEVIRRVLTDAALRKKVLGGIPNDEKKVIKAFALHNAESALKTKPKVRLNLCQSQYTRHLVCTSCIASLALILKRLSVAVCRRIPGLLGFVACGFVQCSKDCTCFPPVDEFQVVQAVFILPDGSAPPGRGVRQGYEDRVVNTCKSCCVHFCTFNR